MCVYIVLWILSADVSFFFVMLFPVHVERVCLSQVCIVLCMLSVWLPLMGVWFLLIVLSIDHMSWVLSVIILVGTQYVCSCIYSIITFCLEIYFKSSKREYS